MTRTEKKWLSAAPWDSVLALNKALCQAQKMDPLNNAKGYEPARRLWEASAQKTMDLQGALGVCHDCQELSPFTFNNGNTFAAIGRTLVDEQLKLVPPVEAQILRTTMCHYIVGLVGRKELQQVLRHFDALLNSTPLPTRAPLEASRVTSAEQQSATA